MIGLTGAAVIPLVILYFVYDKAAAYVMTKFSLNNIIEVPSGNDKYTVRYLRIGLIPV